MKFLSFERLFGGRKQRRGTLKSRPRGARRSAHGTHRPYVETLEDRTLLAVVPTPLVTSRTDITPQPGNGGREDHSSPIIAVDPVDPTKLVTVYTRNNQNLPATAQVAIQASSSSNGG